MVNKVIVNRINEKLREIPNDDKVLIVLKGIPVSLVDSAVGKINLSEVIENKMVYFMNIYGKRNVLSYEEFLLLADFIVAQYKEIYILNNNIYMWQYPVEDCFTLDVRQGLLKHFEESEADEFDDTYIGDISEYIAMFEGIKEVNGYLIGTYSYTPILTNIKIINLNIFDNEKKICL